MITCRTVVGRWFSWSVAETSFENEEVEEEVVVEERALSLLVEAAAVLMSVDSSRSDRTRSDGRGRSGEKNSRFAFLLLPLLCCCGGGMVKSSSFALHGETKTD